MAIVIHVAIDNGYNALVLFIKNIQNVNNLIKIWEWHHNIIILEQILLHAQTL